MKKDGGKEVEEKQKMGGIRVRESGPSREREKNPPLQINGTCDLC